MTNVNHENERPQLPGLSGASGVIHTPQIEVPSAPPVSPKQGRTRREYRWSRTAREMVRNNPNASPAEFSALLTRLVGESGNPRWACRRFMHRMGMRSTRQHRRWTIQEQQRLVKLLDLHPVPEIAKLMRRSQSSIWHMMERVGANAKMGKDSFTKYTLAVALHVRPEKIEEWINRGWLKTREVQTNAGKRTLIDAEEFCEFCRKHTRDAVGNRLSRERLEFVYHFAFPPSHAELLPVRESKKERNAFAAQMRNGSADHLSRDEEEDEEEESGEGDDASFPRIA
jgi:hypothetical protein